MRIRIESPYPFHVTLAVTILMGACSTSGIPQFVHASNANEAEIITSQIQVVDRDNRPIEGVHVLARNDVIEIDDRFTDKDGRATVRTSNAGPTIVAAFKSGGRAVPIRQMSWSSFETALVSAGGRPEDFSLEPPATINRDAQH